MSLIFFIKKTGAKSGSSFFGTLFSAFIYCRGNMVQITTHLNYKKKAFEPTRSYF
tara:strand:- start:99 stop:263 length:165 start_codon:yes stop_codon:yes gene_type:complete